MIVPFHVAHNFRDILYWTMSILNMIDSGFRLKFEWYFKKALLRRVYHKLFMNVGMYELGESTGSYTSKVIRFSSLIFFLHLLTWTGTVGIMPQRCRACFLFPWQYQITCTGKLTVPHNRFLSTVNRKQNRTFSRKLPNFGKHLFYRPCDQTENETSWRFFPWYSRRNL